jgi:DNA-binding Lrp family transcriptional regulator
VDDIDLTIVKMLISNGRASYSSIARSLGISTTTVITRINSMLKGGIIDRFFVMPTLSSLGYTVIHAIIKHDNEDRVMSAVSRLGYLFMKVRCLGDYSVFGLASNTNMDVNKIYDTLSDYRVSYISVVEPAPKRITYNDLLIMKYLIDKNNARARINDIADALQLSVKTVERRLSRMLADGIVRFSMIVNPTAVSNFINFIMIIRSEGDISKSRMLLHDILASNLLMPMIDASDDTIVAVLHVYSTHEMDSLLRRVKYINEVKDVELFVVQRVSIYEEALVSIVDDMIRNNIST